MSKEPNNILKTVFSNRMFVVGLIVLLTLVVTTGFVWLQTDQVIAPPGLRIMDALWKVFFFWK